MKSLVFVLLALLALTLPGPAARAQSDAIDPPLVSEADSLDEFLWVARPVVVFADTPNDPRFIQQMELLDARKSELFARDVVVLTDTDPAARSAIRKQLRPRGFSLVLIGKDGQVELRKPAPWDVREISRAIDKMPLRQQEIRDAKRAGEG